MSEDGVSIRAERPEDAHGVRRVNLLAFGGRIEADLVERLQEADAVSLSLVAEEGGGVVGHLLCSPVEIDAETGGRVPAVGLGPMSVVPERQREGIGSGLVRAALHELERLGQAAVVVLGHPGYYPRFGFVPASRFGLGCEFEAPDEAFMALELRPGALAGAGGLVRYRPEFSEA